MEDKKEAKAEKAKKYRYRQRLALQHPNAVTHVPADLNEKMGGPNQRLLVVALIGQDQIQEIPHRPGKPGGKVEIKGATQAQLKYLYESGNTQIEEYED